MKIKFRIILSMALVVVLLVVQSCSKDKDVVKGAFQSGVLIANEGGFGATNGDVTYYNSTSGLLEQTIFKTVNGSFAGNVLQSISLDADVGYLVINAGNKIEVVDDNTFKSSTTFTDTKLINPRYLQVVNGKGYISVWGSFNSDFQLVDSYVMVIDLKTLSVIKTIDTDEGVENLLYNGKYVFAANYNYGASSTVSVIDPATDTRVTQIDVSAGPSGMVLDVNGKVWVITTGQKSQLVCINPTSLAVEKSVDIGSFAFPDLGISPDKKTLIYSDGSSIYQLSVDAATAPTTAFIDISALTAFYALGVDPKTGEVYASDALNYSTEGDVYIYKTDGTLKTKITAGIAPGQFIFR